MYNAKAYSAASATSLLAPTTIVRREPTAHDVRIEILYPQRDSIDAPGVVVAQLGLVRVSRIDLDGEFPECADTREGIDPLDQGIELRFFQKCRGPPSQVDLHELGGDVAGLKDPLIEIHLLEEEGEIGLDPFIVVADLRVTRAIEALPLAEGEMHIEHE